VISRRCSRGARLMARAMCVDAGGARRRAIDCAQRRGPRAVNLRRRGLALITALMHVWHAHTLPSMTLWRFSTDWTSPHHCRFRLLRGKTRSSRRDSPTGVLTRTARQRRRICEPFGRLADRLLAQRGSHAGTSVSLRVLPKSECDPASSAKKAAIRNCDSHRSNRSVRSSHMDATSARAIARVEHVPTGAP